MFDHTTNQDTQCCSQSDYTDEPKNGSKCEGLEKQLELCQKETTDWREKFLRSQADFDNYRRRSEKERSQWITASQRDVIVSLLPIVDDVERALTELQKKEKTPDMDIWFSGFSMIAQSLQKVLKQWHVSEITEIKTFNPELHEAIVSVEVPDKRSGEIVAVLQKGYRMNEDVLRPAKVSVVK